MTDLTASMAAAQEQHRRVRQHEFRDRLRIAVENYCGHEDDGTDHCACDLIMRDIDAVLADATPCEEATCRHRRALRDLHVALGVEWGADPFPVIQTLRGVFEHVPTAVLVLHLRQMAREFEAAAVIIDNAEFAARYRVQAVNLARAADALDPGHQSSAD